MTPWEWDEKGHFWFNRETGEELTPQELMERHLKLVDDYEHLHQGKTLMEDAWCSPQEYEKLLAEIQSLRDTIEMDITPRKCAWCGKHTQAGDRVCVVDTCH